MKEQWTVKLQKGVIKKHVPRLPSKVAQLVDEAVFDMENEGPFPHGWNVKMIGKGKCRMHLKYSWRMVYSYNDEILHIEVMYAGSKENVPY